MFGSRLMKSCSSLLPVLLLSLVIWPSSIGLAQEDVKIPKSRLEELERKERELEQLKGDVNKAKNQNSQLKDKTKPETNAAVVTTAEPVATHISPPIASLPALKPQDLVESLDLASYYAMDAATADQRYRHQKLRVRGEIVGLEKPLFMRNYRVLLKTPGRETRVICDLLPPDNSNAVFTSDHGSQLVVMAGEKRTVLAKVGDIAVVKGECKGLKGGAVMISCWELALMR